MKKILVILFLMAISSASLAQSLMPLFFMSYKTSAFTPPQYALAKECSIFRNFVEIKTKDIDGDHSHVKEVRENPYWDGMIAQVANGALVQNNSGMPADFGRSIYLAFYNSKEVILRAYNDDGQLVLNNSSLTPGLMSTIDEICK